MPPPPQLRLLSTHVRLLLTHVLLLPNPAPACPARKTHARNDASSRFWVSGLLRVASAGTKAPADKEKISKNRQVGLGLDVVITLSSRPTLPVSCRGFFFCWCHICFVIFVFVPGAYKIPGGIFFFALQRVARGVASGARDSGENALLVVAL